MGVVRTVVVLPGRSFGAYVPQLFFPMMAAMRRGAEPIAVSWTAPDAVDELPFEDTSSWVANQVAPVVRDLDPATTLVIGKSLGSYAAGVVADLGMPAIWVTPLLINSEVVAGLRRSTSPFLLAGGTADNSWDPNVARALTAHVVEIAGADHGLFDPGPLDQSAGNIGIVAAASERFLDEVVWPPRAGIGGRAMITTTPTP